MGSRSTTDKEEEFMTKSVIYETRRNEKVEFNNSPSEFVSRVNFLTIPKVRTLKTQEKFDQFLLYPYGIIAYIGTERDEQ